jgi:hypothetical protein
MKDLRNLLLSLSLNEAEQQVKQVEKAEKEVRLFSA